MKGKWIAKRWLVEVDKEGIVAKRALGGPHQYIIKILLMLAYR
jgi:hypothetical protein